MSEAKLKSTKGTGLKILTSKQMLERLPIVLAQVKAQKKGQKKKIHISRRKTTNYWWAKVSITIK